MHRDMHMVGQMHFQNPIEGIESASLSVLNVLTSLMSNPIEGIESEIQSAQGPGGDC